MGEFTGPASRSLGGRKIISLESLPVVPAPPIGNQVIFQIQGAVNSTGPYDQPNNCSLLDGITINPIPNPLGPAPLGDPSIDPILVNGQTLTVFGSVGIGPIWYYTVCLVGTVSIDHFSTLAFDTISDGPASYNAVDAEFNTLFAAPGFSIWAWEMPGTGFPSGFPSNNSDITIAWP